MGLDKLAIHRCYVDGEAYRGIIKESPGIRGNSTVGTEYPRKTRYPVQLISLQWGHKNPPIKLGVRSLTETAYNTFYEKKL